MAQIDEGVVLEGAINFYKETDLTRPLSVTSYNEFYFVVSGKIDFRLADKTFAVKSGEIACIPALTLYACDFSNAEVWRLTCGERYLADFYDCYPTMTLPFCLDDVKFNKQVLMALRSEITSDDSTEFEKRTALNYFLSKSVKRYGAVVKGHENDSLICEIVSYIYQNYDKDITLESLAQEFCISKMVLSRKLSKYLGVDLRRFVSEVRINAFVKLRREKENENLSSVELAYKCGFRSYETFYRTYKRYLGE